MSQPPVAQVFEQVAGEWQCKTCGAKCGTRASAAIHYKRKHPAAKTSEPSMGAQLIAARAARDCGEPYDRFLVDQFKDYE